VLPAIKAAVKIARVMMVKLRVHLSGSLAKRNIEKLPKTGLD